MNRGMSCDVDGKSRAIAPLKSSDTLYEKYRQADLGEMYTLRNKEPVWNERLRAFVLNFHGRVTQASVKNFQLINPEDGKIHSSIHPFIHSSIHSLKRAFLHPFPLDTDSSDFLLLFGRVDKNMFNLDFRFPFSPLQAFLVALASLDRKLACE
jgi:tubby and related proteins